MSTISTTLETYSPDNSIPENKELEVINFLYKHLDQYGDARADIGRAVDYAMGRDGRPGGLLICNEEEGVLTGAIVINKTGMKGYIPENILVYIAVDRSQRGKGIGKQLMKAAIEHTEGAVALHVEPDNPARFLYEKMGFENKYLEMRLQK